MVLLKNPNSIDSKVGEAAALIGLKRTTEAKAILFASPEYQNNAYDNELLGDAYFTDGNYEEATNYYLNATGLYMKPIINETGAGGFQSFCYRNETWRNQNTWSLQLPICNSVWK